MRFAQLLESRLPLRVGVLLAIGFELLRCQVVGLEPAVLVLLVAEANPGDVSGRVEAGHQVIVSHRLVFEPVFQAPGSEPQLGVGVLLGRAHAAIEVFAEEGLELGVALDFLLDLFGLGPFSLEGDQAQEASRQHVRGVERDGYGQMLDSLGRQAVGFAPESELNVGGGVFPGLGRGRLRRQHDRLRLSRRACRRRRARHSRAGLRGP